MSSSRPLQLYLLGIISLLFSVKVKEKCEWCSVILMLAFVMLFVVASFLVIKNKKKIKRLKDKDLV